MTSWATTSLSRRTIFRIVGYLIASAEFKYHTRISFLYALS